MLPVYVFTDASHTNDRYGRHTYRAISTWVACGFAPPSGWDGCVGARGEELLCTDGAHVYTVSSDCTSTAAAEREVAAQVASTMLQSHEPGDANVRSLDSGTIVHFAVPVAPPGQADADCHWLYIWTSPRGFRTLYAPDYEHLKDRLTVYGINLPKDTEGGA